MSYKIEELKRELRKAYQEELTDLTVCVKLTLNSYGFYTQIEERTADSLKDEGISMRNLKREWIK